MKTRSLRAGDRVVVVGAHPWNGYAGQIIKKWPLGGDGLDWLVRLDNGQLIGVNADDLEAVPPTARYPEPLRSLPPRGIGQR